MSLFVREFKTFVSLQSIIFLFDVITHKANTAVAVFEMPPERKLITCSKEGNEEVQYSFFS
jgi:hypothetical protein